MNPKTTRLITTISMWTIVGLGLILSIAIIMGGETDPSGETLANEGAVSAALWLSYTVLGLCSLGAIGFGVYYFATHIQQNIKTLIGLGVFLLAILLSFLVASSDPGSGWSAEVYDEISGWPAKISGASLYAFYFLFIGVVVSVLYAEVGKIFK